ncbi:MAG: cytochrome P450 [Terriglobales bacterium]
MAAAETTAGRLSLTRLLDPAVLADPYPLYDQLRQEDPVHWDPYLHAWVVTRYADVITVLRHFSAARTPTPEQLTALGLRDLRPVAAVLVRQMLFLDPPAHTRIRALAAQAFTPSRVAEMRDHIRAIVARLLAPASARGSFEVIADLAAPLPSIVTAEMLGVPSEDHARLKRLSAEFAGILGNFQHNPDRIARMLAAVEELTAYFQCHIAALRAGRGRHAGLVASLLAAEVDGDRLSDEEVVANAIITMVGGQETTTNLIGNGLLTLLRHPGALARLRADPEAVPLAVEELLRFESPSQHTARLAPAKLELGGRKIGRGQAVVAVMAAANRDPEQFPNPATLDLGRQPNHHVAFGWGAHFCFGSALARIEGQEALHGVLQGFPQLALSSEPLRWRSNLALRGLEALPLLAA